MGGVSVRADPIGRRRLFVAEGGGCTVVASDATTARRALAALGVRATISRRSLARFLRFSFVPWPDSPWNQIRALAPGARLALGGAPHEASVSPAQVVVRDVPEAEAAAHLGALLAPAPEARAVLLSSGVDSALVAACMPPGATAFTLDLGAASEADVAARIAGHLGHRHVRVPVREGDLEALLTRAVAALDVPIGDPVVVPFVAAADAVAGEGHDAVVTGEGGDQSFAGWSTRPLLAWLSYGPDLAELPRMFAGTFHKLGDVADDALTPELSREDVTTDESLVAPWFTEEALRRAGGVFGALTAANLAWKGVQNVAVRIERVLASRGIAHVAPFFDERLVAYAAGLPMAQKVRGTTDKWILRRMLEARGLGDVAGLPKRGMQVPIREWLDGPLRTMVRDLLSPRVVRHRGLFREGFVARLLEGEVDVPDLRRRRRDEWLWLAFVTELWLREHGA